MLLPKYIRDVIGLKNNAFEPSEVEKISPSAIYKFSSAFNEAKVLGKIAKTVNCIDAGDLAIFLAIDEVLHHLLHLYKKANPSFLAETYSHIEEKFEQTGFSLQEVLISFLNLFPVDCVYDGRISSIEYAKKNEYTLLEELILFVLLLENPAISKKPDSTISSLLDENALLSLPAYLVFKNAISDIEDVVQVQKENLNENSLESSMERFLEAM